MSSNDKNEGEELLLDLSNIISLTLEELIELDKDRSDHVGQEIANRMAKNWGGNLIYFRKGTYIACARNHAIWDDFTGDNHRDLVRKYGVSLQWIYKIVKAMRAADLASRQGDMFSNTEAMK